jgi:hypothetical protein
MPPEVDPDAPPPPATDPDPMPNDDPPNPNREPDGDPPVKPPPVRGGSAMASRQTLHGCSSLLHASSL